MKQLLSVVLACIFWASPFAAWGQVSTEASLKILKSRDEPSIRRFLVDLRGKTPVSKPVAEALVPLILKGSRPLRDEAIELLKQAPEKPANLIPEVVSRLNECELGFNRRLPECRSLVNVLWEVYSGPKTIARASLLPVFHAYQSAGQDRHYLAMFELGMGLVNSPVLLPEFLDSLLVFKTNNDNLDVLGNIIRIVSERALEVPPKFFADFIKSQQDPGMYQHAWFGLYQYGSEARDYYPVLASSYKLREFYELDNYEYPVENIGRCDRHIPLDLLLIPIYPGHQKSLAFMKSQILSAKEFAWCECRMLSHMPEADVVELLDGVQIGSLKLGIKGTLMPLLECLVEQRDPSFLVEYLFNVHPQFEQVLQDLIERDVISPHDLLDIVEVRFDSSKGRNAREQEFVLSLNSDGYPFVQKELARKFMDSSSAKVRSKALDIVASMSTHIEVDQKLLMVLQRMLDGSERETALEFVDRIPPLNRLQATRPEETALIKELLKVSDFRMLRWLWVKRNLHTDTRITIPQLIERYPYQDIAPILKSQAALWVGTMQDASHDLATMIEIIANPKTAEPLRNDLREIVDGLFGGEIFNAEVKKTAAKCISSSEPMVKNLCYKVYQQSGHREPEAAVIGLDISTLITDYKNGNEEAKRNAALELMRLSKKQPDLVEPYVQLMIQGLRNEKDPIRQWFASALGHYPAYADQSVPALIEASEVNYFALNGSAIQSLQTLATPAAKNQLANLYTVKSTEFIESGDRDAAFYVGHLWKTEGKRKDAPEILKRIVQELQKKPWEYVPYTSSVAEIANTDWAEFETQITPLFDKLCTESEEGRNQNIIGDITWRLFSAGVQSANSVFLRCLHRIPNSKQQFCDNLRFISKDRRSTWNGYSELLEACDRQ